MWNFAWDLYKNSIFNSTFNNIHSEKLVSIPFKWFPNHLTSTSCRGELSATKVLVDSSLYWLRLVGISTHRSGWISSLLSFSRILTQGGPTCYPTKTQLMGKKHTFSYFFQFEKKIAMVFLGDIWPRTMIKSSFLLGFPNFATPNLATECGADTCAHHSWATGSSWWSCCSKQKTKKPCFHACHFRKDRCPSPVAMEVSSFDPHLTSVSHPSWKHIFELHVLRMSLSGNVGLHIDHIPDSHLR